MTQVTQNLEVDPNDPRRNVVAKPNLSNLNKEDPEKEPKPQNPVKETVVSTDESRGNKDGK